MSTDIRGHEALHHHHQLVKCWSHLTRVNWWKVDLIWAVWTGERSISSELRELVKGRSHLSCVNWWKVDLIWAVWTGERSISSELCELVKGRSHLSCINWWKIDLTWAVWSGEMSISSELYELVKGRSHLSCVNCWWVDLIEGSASFLYKFSICSTTWYGVDWGIHGDSVWFQRLNCCNLPHLDAVVISRKQWTCAVSKLAGFFFGIH